MSHLTIMKEQTKQPEKAYAAGTPSQYSKKDSALPPVAARQYDPASPKGTPPLDDILDKTRFQMPQRTNYQGEASMMDLLANVIMNTYMQMGQAYKAMQSFYQKAEQSLGAGYQPALAGGPAYAAKPGYSGTTGKK
ncbi:MAG: hypothetical protein AABY13_06120 [Nanoarchaeota archaeon]